MKKLTKRGAVYFILTIIGIMSAIYLISIKNYKLLAVSILFAGVSAYNITCDLN